MVALDRKAAKAVDMEILLQAAVGRLYMAAHAAWIAGMVY